MNKKYITNQLKEYKKLASTIDYIHNPKGRANIFIHIAAFTLSFLMTLYFTLAFILRLDMLNTSGATMGLIELLNYAVFILPSSSLANYTLDLRQRNYYKMQRISEKIKRKLINIDLNEIFDVNCPFTKNVIKENKDLLLKSYSEQNSLKVETLLSLISSIENKKQWDSENKRVEMKKFLEKKKIQETCMILEQSNTVNSKNISLINSIGA